MHKKKFLAKLVLASVLTGGINFLPAVPIFHAGNFQVSVAHAEIKTFAAKNTAMTDVESLTNAAKSTAQERALNLAQKKAETFLKTFSPTLRGRLTDEDISAVVINNFKIVNAPLYRKLYYQAVDENGNDLGRNGEIYEATVTINIDTAALDKYRKLGAQQREKLIKQAQNAQAAFEEIDRDFEELRKNARTKSPKQLQADINKFDAKISKAEKSRKKNQSATPPAIVQDKPAITEDKPAPPVTNQPMQFSQPVKIGELNLPPMGFFEITKADYHKGVPCTVKGYEHLGLYEKGIARFGNGEDALYFHYDAKNSRFTEMVIRFGSQDIKNTIEDSVGIPTIIWKIKTNTGRIFYMLEHGDAAGFGAQRTLIGKNEKGTFVKYFNTYKIKDTYLGERNHRGIGDEWNKFYFQKDTIIIRYGKYGRVNRFNAMGEFRFKWDEKAQWFGVEHIKY